MARSRLCQFNTSVARLSLLLALLVNTNLNVMAQDKATDQAKGSTTKDCVVVLHGLARTSYSMRPVARALTNEYNVINQGYPSRKHSIETLSELAITPALKQCPSDAKVHFVTHSLGGILVRHYLSEHNISNLGHVVMLGPPNNGSEVVDQFQSTPVSNWFFSKANGPAGAQLGTQDQSHPVNLGPVKFSLGVIAGNVSYSPFFSRAIDGEDDGKVSVERSKVDGMKDHITLPVSHTFMMNDVTVIQQVQYFLQHGAFLR